MRSLIVCALALVAVCYASPVPEDDWKPSPIKDVMRYITQEGYPAEKKVVQTNDGYILDLYRIPGPSDWNQNTPTKTPILLMHGLVGSADEFLVGGSSRGLAFKLADRGFDVYMGNARGSKYGRKHSFLNPNLDPTFWRYTWDDIGMKDLPAIIEEITAITKQRKMHYIGYNQGNTAFFAMASTKTEYNSRILKMIALGPMVYLENAHHPLMSTIRANIKSPQWLAQHIGEHEYSPSSSLKTQVKPDCTSKQIDEQVCDNFYFLTNGYSRNFNQSIVPQLRVEKPTGVSVNQLKHYAQLLNTVNFAQYDRSREAALIAASASDEGDSSSSSDEQPGSQYQSPYSGPYVGREYDLAAVTAEVHLLYVPKDSWASQQDISKLRNKLTNAQETYAYSAYSSNVDLILAKDAYQKVHDKILNILQ